MTYREQIQKMVADSEALYVQAGKLRDASQILHKEMLSDFRNRIGNAVEILNRIDNSLTQATAAMEV